MIATIEFHLHPPDGQAVGVPFSLLVRMLEGMQQVIYLLALQHEGRSIGERLRLPSEVADKYRLQALLPKPGSYTQPAVLGNASADLIAPADIARVAESYAGLNRALEQRDYSAVRTILPDRRLRRRILREYQEATPTKESGWRLQTIVDEHGAFISGQDIEQAIEATLSQEEKESVSSVIGKLMKIDFGEKIIYLRYAPTSKNIRCSYNEFVEDLLLRNPRGLIQVVGEVTVGNDGAPQRISQVEDIREVDLAPFELSVIPLETGSLRAVTSFKVNVELDDSSQSFTAADPEVGIDARADSREELLLFVEEQIDMLWQTYAKADDAELTPNALKRKRALLERFQENRHAA